MVLYMIGLGLGKKEDVTVSGLNAIKSSDFVYLENYTSVLIDSSIEDLEKYYGKNIIVGDRDFVEKNVDEMLNNAKENVVSFLVVGDVFGATTHADLYLRAKELGVDIKVINNASILNAVGNTGLELYKFGKVPSIVFDDAGWLPDTPYKVLEQNLSQGLHTLFLLDIKVKEPSRENILKGINKPEKPRFMNVNKALDILLRLEENAKRNVLSKDTLVIGIARLGSDSQIVKYGKISELIDFDFGSPLHSLIIPGKMHFIEEDMLNLWKI